MFTLKPPAQRLPWGWQPGLRAPLGAPRPAPCPLWSPPVKWVRRRLLSGFREMSVCLLGGPSSRGAVIPAGSCAAPALFRPHDPIFPSARNGGYRGSAGPQVNQRTGGGLAALGGAWTPMPCSPASGWGARLLEGRVGPNGNSYVCLGSWPGAGGPSPGLAPPARSPGFLWAPKAHPCSWGNMALHPPRPGRKERQRPGVLCSPLGCEMGGTSSPRCVLSSRAGPPGVLLIIKKVGAESAAEATDSCGQCRPRGPTWAAPSRRAAWTARPCPVLGCRPIQGTGHPPVAPCPSCREGRAMGGGGTEVPCGTSGPCELWPVVFCCHFCRGRAWLEAGDSGLGGPLGGQRGSGCPVRGARGGHVGQGRGGLGLLPRGLLRACVRQTGH